MSPQKRKAKPAETRERTPLTESEIVRCVDAVIAENVADDHRPFALILLLDEIAHDISGGALLAAQRAVLRSPLLADRIVDRIAARLRPHFAESGTPEWSIREAVEAWRVEKLD